MLAMGWALSLVLGELKPNRRKAPQKLTEEKPAGSVAWGSGVVADVTGARLQAA